MDWLRASGRRATVVLVALVGVLSLLTGILQLTTAVPLGIVDPYLPSVVTDIAGFTGAMTGFVLLFVAYLLRRGSPGACYAALFLLPISAVQGVIQSSAFSLPLIGLSLLAMPVVWSNRRAFTRPLSLDAAQIAAGIALIGAFAYGTFGTFALRDRFEIQGESVQTLLDAFYFTVVTATTVGYGDVIATDQFARLFSLSVIFLTVASFAVALGTLLAPALEARFESALGRMTDTELESLQSHVIVLGVGDLTTSVLEAVDADTPVVVVTSDAEAAARLHQRGHRVVDGSPTDTADLERARLSRARSVIVATDDDGDDVLAILTVREVSPEVTIVAAATNRENVAKMERAGADVVISPADLGGRMLADAASADSAE